MLIDGTPDPEVSLDKLLNRLGSEGWELVSTNVTRGTDTALVLKRVGEKSPIDTPV